MAEVIGRSVDGNGYIYYYKNFVRTIMMLKTHCILLISFAIILILSEIQFNKNQIPVFMLDYSIKFV